jgi:tetratricopeptide (TPR) repeat protein
VHAAIEAAGRNPTPKTLGQLGMLYDGHGVLESAVVLYKQVLKLAKTNSSAWHLLGRALYDLGRTDQAISALQRAVELAPQQPAGFARLAEAQMAAGDVDGADISWRRYLVRRPEDPLGLIGLARAVEAQGDHEEALALAKSALEKDPRAQPALILAARAEARLGDTTAAKVFSDRAALLTKDDAPVLVDEVDLAMREHARSVSYLREITNVLKENRKFGKAYYFAKLLAERRPDEAQNWKMLGWLATRMNRPEAMEHIQVALEIDPEFAEGWELVAKSKLVSGKYNEALEAADRAINLDESLEGTQLTRGLSLAGLQRYEEALQPLEKALAGQPQNENGLAAMALCLIKTGQTEKARDVLIQLLAVNPNHAWGKKTFDEL